MMVEWAFSISLELKVVSQDFVLQQIRDWAKLSSTN
jgi:hypothetical protein